MSLRTSSWVRVLLKIFRSSKRALASLSMSEGYHALWPMKHRVRISWGGSLAHQIWLPRRIPFIYKLRSVPSLRAAKWYHWVRLSAISVRKVEYTPDWPTPNDGLGKPSSVTRRTAMLFVLGPFEKSISLAPLSAVISLTQARILKLAEKYEPFGAW